jgi:kinesin family member 21
MERYIEQREKIGRKLNRLQKRYEKVLNQNDEDSKGEDLKEQLDIMKSNVDYIQDQISECQANIIELDDSKVKLNENF